MSDLTIYEVALIVEMATLRIKQHEELLKLHHDSPVLTDLVERELAVYQSIIKKVSASKI